MVQFVLDEQVEVWWEAEVEIVAQMGSVITPGQADDLDCIPLSPQIFHQFAIIQIAAAERIQRTIDD